MDTVRIALTCPMCGCAAWVPAAPDNEEGFKCLSCGGACSPEQMGSEVQPLPREALPSGCQSIETCRHCGSVVDVDDCSTEQCWTNEGDRVVYHKCPVCGEAIEEISF